MKLHCEVMRCFCLLIFYLHLRGFKNHINYNIVFKANSFIFCKCVDLVCHVSVVVGTKHRKINVGINPLGDIAAPNGTLLDFTFVVVSQSMTRGTDNFVLYIKSLF